MKNTVPGCAFLAAFLAVSALPSPAANPPETLVYKRVSYSACSPSLPGFPGTANPAAAMVSAIAEGNVSVVDALLDGGSVALDAPICLSSRGSGTLETSSKSWMLQERNYAAAAAVSPTGNPLDAPVLPGLWDPVFACAWTASSAPAGAMPSLDSDYYHLHGTPLMVAARLGNSFMVRHLLERGANPNVFIEVGGAGNGMWDLYAARRHVDRPWLFALSETYRLVATASKNTSKMDEIARLLIDAGAILPPEDGYGRNGLWDAAIARSVPMLDLALASGLDINAEDHTGLAVSECTQAVTGDERWSAFLRALRDRGATGGDASGTPEHGFGDVPPVPAPRNALPSGGFGSTAPAPAPAPFPAFAAPSAPGRDAARAASLESRLAGLRRQLDEANRNLDAAIERGTSWVTASMRVSSLQSEIAQVEGELLSLRH